MEFAPGTRVDRYMLVETLGKGGQGTVWKVVDQLDRAVVALKLLKLSELPPTAAERARSEARAVRELKGHPAIVPCHVLFELSNDVIGLVFDLVPGKALSEAMRDSRMTNEHRAAVLEQLASALAHVHARGLVHRDLKPGNVIVTDAFWSEPRAAGSVKLVDFGIVAPSGNRARITVEGRPVGTAPYLAPELLLPSRWKQLDEAFAQDIFAFGVLAFELFAGRHPTGLSLLEKRPAFGDAYRAADEGRIPWPPKGMAGPFAPVIARCLALDPAARPASGTELARLTNAKPHASAPRADRESRPISATTATHTPPTELHAAPGSSVYASTMPGEPPSPSARSSGASANAASAPRARSSAKTILGRILAIAAIVTVAVVAWALGRSSAPSRTDTTSQVPTFSLSPLPDPTTRPPAERSPMPCCSDDGRCKSGRPCGPGKCDAGIPDRSWRLRITGVAARTAADWRLPDSFSEDYSLTHPNAQVCVQRAGVSGSRVCSPLRDAAATPDGDRKNRALVSTADLQQGGLEIWVEEKGRIHAHDRTGRPQGNKFLMTGLCKGIHLFIGTKEKAPMRVAGYLDDG